MSLDGFIAGPGDAMDWVFANAAVEEVIQTTGAILAGRRTYDTGRRDAGKPSGAAYGGAWTGPLFVLTTLTAQRRTASPRNEWPRWAVIRHFGTRGGAGT